MADGAGAELVAHERELRTAWQAAHMNRHAADRETIQIARASIDGRLEEFGRRLRELENASNNLQGRLWVLGGAIAVGVSAVVVLVDVAIKVWK